MGLFDKLFSRPANKTVQNHVDGYFDTLTAYRPAFTTWNGGLYESELVRAAINAKATHISKLLVETFGSAQPGLQTRIRVKPNEYQTWGQFLYRVSTILDMQNNAFIAPTRNQYGEITGVYPVLPSECELVQYKGEPFIKCTFQTGKSVTFALSEIAMLTRFQYKDEFFGENNTALNSTMKLIDIQNQGITEGVKSAATYRFMARMENFSKPDDLAKERKRFNSRNFEDEGGGLLLFPSTYTNIQQIDSKPFIVDSAQMELIQKNVFNYFGVNEDVLQNKAYGDAWTAFYEGAIEPFAIQLSDALTNMLFTRREIVQGSGLHITSNRLQYMSNADKLQVSAQMADRGIMSINEIRQIWNLAPVEGGDVRVARGEYHAADGSNTEEANDATEE